MVVNGSSAGGGEMIKGKVFCFALGVVGYEVVRIIAKVIGLPEISGVGLGLIVFIGALYFGEEEK